jgi:hypothetical protein
MVTVLTVVVLFVGVPILIGHFLYLASNDEASAMRAEVIDGNE